MNIVELLYHLTEMDVHWLLGHQGQAIETEAQQEFMNINGPQSPGYKKVVISLGRYPMKWQVPPFRYLIMATLWPLDPLDLFSKEA